MTPRKEFRKNLKALRKLRGLTQGELAEIAGCHRNTIVNWERGPEQPCVNELLSLAEALDCTIGELAGEEP